MITYATGDATKPPVGGLRVITHICNDEGTWGAGFVLALSRRDKAPENAYKTWHTMQPTGFALGRIQVVPYATSEDPNLFVANMIAQHGFGYTDTQRVFHPPIRYTALASCLLRLRFYLEMQTQPVSVHMPRIGCGLGGGSWNNVEPLIEKFIASHGIPVTVYDLPNPMTIDFGTPGACCGPSGCS